MTFEQAQKAIYTTTERTAVNLAEVMLDNYDQAFKEITIEINKAYARLSGVPANKYRDEVLKVRNKITRLRALQIEIRDIYNKYARKANRETLKISETSMSQIYYKKEFVMAAYTDYIPLILDPRLIELTVMGTEKAWKAIPESLKKRYGDMMAFQPSYGTITEIFARHRFNDLKKIQLAITQAFIQGQSNREAVKNIMKIFDTTKSNAMKIVQTEFNRVANAGAYAANVDAANQGIDIKKMWLIQPTLNPHKPPHSILDGVKKRPKQYFKLGGYKALYPGNFNGGSHNYNCHCSIIDIIKGVKPTFRRVRNPLTGKQELFDFDDFPKWGKEKGFL